MSLPGVESWAMDWIIQHGSPERLPHACRSRLAVFAAAVGLTLSCATAPPSENSTDDKASIALLTSFAEAWNRHDLDALMSMMTDDCVFEASGGLDVSGQRIEGQEAVRQSFAAVFERFSDARWDDTEHFVHGNIGVSRWTFRGTLASGQRVEVTGCDFLTLRDGKIAVKNSYRKNRPPFDP